MTAISPLIYQTVHCAKILRDSFPGMMLAGGHHATAFPRLTLERIPELDGVGIGEGEEALLALAQGTTPDNINGILWRRTFEKNKDAKTGQAHEPGFGRIQNLDALPFPDFSLFDTAFYTRRTIAILRGFYLSTLTMIGSRGCNYRCSFCVESLVYGNGVRFHSVDYITEMVERTLRQYPQVEAVYFHDNDFMIDPSRVEQICRRFINTVLPGGFMGDSGTGGQAETGFITINEGSRLHQNRNWRGSRDAGRFGCHQKRYRCKHQRKSVKMVP
jgi:anaerobic magnesium-protoporphyrin IX monomethyl ester cyclase